MIAGWSDASSGPLIPYIQAYYGVSYTIVSMLFVGQMIGWVFLLVDWLWWVLVLIWTSGVNRFLSAGFINTHLTARFGLVSVLRSTPGIWYVTILICSDTKGRVITLGAIIQVFGYIFLVPAFPFPIMYALHSS